MSEEFAKQFAISWVVFHRIAKSNSSTYLMGLKTDYGFLIVNLDVPEGPSARFSAVTSRQAPRMARAVICLPHVHNCSHRLSWVYSSGGTRGLDVVMSGVEPFLHLSTVTEFVR